MRKEKIEQYLKKLCIKVNVNCMNYNYTRFFIQESQDFDYQSFLKYYLHYNEKKFRVKLDEHNHNE